MSAEKKLYNFRFNKETVDKLRSIGAEQNRTMTAIIVDAVDLYALRCQPSQHQYPEPVDIHRLLSHILAEIPSDMRLAYLRPFLPQ